MNKQPISYKQYDPLWASIPYNGPGENDKTIKSSGCGPTCAAMLITTLIQDGSVYTPEDACRWSVQNGYKYANQGTAYNYFAPQFAEFGIDCFQLSWTNVYHNPDHKIHDQALDYLNKGYYLIGLAKKGHWTTSGHFIVIYDFDEKYVYVNDPISSAASRAKAPIETMRTDIAYYWVVDARAYNRPQLVEKEEEEMSKDDFRQLWRECMEEYRKERRDNDTQYGDGSKSAREFVVKNAIINGDSLKDPNFMWEDFLTREQAAIIITNLCERFGLKPKQ